MSYKTEKLIDKLLLLSLLGLIIFVYGNLTILAQNTDKTLSGKSIKNENQTENGHPTEWYLNYRNKNEPKIYVYEIGRGEKVVVLHGGFGAEHSYLIDAVSGLEDKFRFVFYDQRGSLRSPAKLENISIEKHIEDLEALRLQLGEEKINILAHSMGTVLAMMYLQKYPGRVKRLIQVSALPVQTNDFGQLFENKFNKAVEQLIGRDVWKKEKEKIAPGGKPENDEQATNLWKIDFASANIYQAEKWRQMKGGQSFYNGKVGSKTSSTLSRSWDLTEEISRHPYPVTYIQGAKDFIDLDVIDHKKQLAGIETIELITIENAGHNIWIDEPESFRKALFKALTK